MDERTEKQINRKAESIYESYLKTIAKSDMNKCIFCINKDEYYPGANYGTASILNKINEAGYMKAFKMISKLSKHCALFRTVDSEGREFFEISASEMPTTVGHVGYIYVYEIE